MLEKVPGDVTLRCWPYLVAKSFHAGVDVDELACPLHHPMAYNCQMRGRGFLLGVVLSRRAIAGGGTLLEDVKPSGLDICEGVDRLGTCIIEFCAEQIAFTRICSPYAGIIMVCICVSQVELSFQIVMGQILVLKCILSGVRGSCSRIIFHQAVSATAPRGPEADHAYPISGSPWEG
jgi:hypothetical protein